MAADMVAVLGLVRDQTVPGIAPPDMRTQGAGEAPGVDFCITEGVGGVRLARLSVGVEGHGGAIPPPADHLGGDPVGGSPGSSRAGRKTPGGLLGVLDEPGDILFQLADDEEGPVAPEVMVRRRPGLPAEGGIAGVFRGGLHRRVAEHGRQDVQGVEIGGQGAGGRLSRTVVGVAQKELSRLDLVVRRPAVATQTLHDRVRDAVSESEGFCPEAATHHGPGGRGEGFHQLQAIHASLDADGVVAVRRGHPVGEQDGVHGVPLHRGAGPGRVRPFPSGRP